MSAHKAKQGAGRPNSSGNILVTPEYLEEPDIEKLGLALIAVAKSIAEKKKAGELALKNGDYTCKAKKSHPPVGKGDTVA